MSNLFKLFKLLLVFLCGSFLTAYAFAEEQGKSSLLFEVAAQTNGGGGKSSTTAKQLYVEKTLTDEESVWGLVYDDPAFRAMYVGGAKKFSDLQVAVGIGSARYGRMSHLIVNPWVYYSKNSLEGYLSAEHYSREEAEPWFIKGYVHKDITEKVFVGVYGESGFGVGPMIGTSLFDKKLKIWLSVPVASRSNDAKAIVNATWEF